MRHFVGQYLASAQTVMETFVIIKVGWALANRLLDCSCRAPTSGHLFPNVQVSPELEP